jgi:hypothetical protein
VTLSSTHSSVRDRLSSLPIKTGRRCRGLELDPLYVDVILRRYEAASGRPAVLESTGETYAELAERRQCDAEARPEPLSNVEKPAEDGIPTSPTLRR